jgi:hypothetical protein
VKSYYDVIEEPADVAVVDAMRKEDREACEAAEA